MTLEEYCEIIYNSHPKLKYCEWFDETSAKWNLEKHTHPYIELIFFLDGKASLTVDGNDFRTSLYDTVVYPAGSEHQDGKSGGRKREIICLWVDIPALVLEKPILLHERSHTIRDLFKAIYAQEKSVTRPAPHLMEYLLKTLLTLILQEAVTNRGGWMSSWMPSSLISMNITGSISHWMNWQNWSM